MRNLNKSTIIAATRTPLSELEALYLDGRDVEKIGDSFVECTRLVSLSLASNALACNLANLRRCSNLWFVNLSNNHLCSLEGLDQFTCMGYLDLGHNKLPTDELRRLCDVDIISLRVEGNKLIERSLRGAGLGEYRRGVLSLVPSPWVLDGQFVLSEERLGGGGRPAESSAAASLAPPARGEPLFGWTTGEWGTEPAVGVGDLAVAHLQTLKDQPRERLDASGASARDMFRLKHLARRFDQDAQRYNSYVRRMVYGTRPKPWPSMHLESLRAADREIRLDLLLCLAAELAFAVPKAVGSECLVVLLGSSLGRAAALEVAALPRFAKSALIFSLRRDLLDEVASVPEGPNALPLDRQQILAAVPPIVAGAFAKALGTGESIIARHASILFSRAPCCPPLVPTRGAALTPQQQRTYDALVPLLSAAGFSSTDLTILRPPTGSSPRATGDSILAASALPAADRGVIEEILAEHMSLPGDNSTDGSDDEGPPSNLLHARRPRLGERVRLSPSGPATTEGDGGTAVALVVDVSEGGDRVSVRGGGLRKAHRSLERGDLFWDSRGWWVHTSSLALAPRVSAPRVQARCQPMSPRESVFPKLDNEHRRGQANAVHIFKGRNKELFKDPEFVLAPSGEARSDRVTAGSSLPEWVPVESSPRFAVGALAPSSSDDLPYPLAPRRSVAGDLLASREASREASEAHWSRSRAIANNISEPSAGEARSEAMLVALSLSHISSGPTDWETLQREMGTFLAANQGPDRPRRASMVDMDSLRAELRLRRQQEAGVQPKARSGVNSSDEGRGVFELTFVNAGAEEESEEVDEATVGRPEATPSPEKSGLAARVEAELLAQQANALRIRKARVRPWRTVSMRAPRTIVPLDGSELPGGSPSIPATIEPLSDQARPSSSEASAALVSEQLPLFRPRLPVHTKAHVQSGGCRRARPRPPAPAPPSFLTIGAVKRPGGDAPLHNGELDDRDLCDDNALPPEELLEGDNHFWYNGRNSRLVRIVNERNELGWHRKEGLATIIKAARAEVTR